MGIQLEFYVILLMWLSMLGSPQITGKIIDNIFFQGYIIFPGVSAGAGALFVHVFKKNFLILNVKREDVWHALISNFKLEDVWHALISTISTFKLEDVFHYLSLIILFFGFYRAINHIRCLANRETAKNESEKLEGNTSHNN